jgi:hypothetical protein
VTVCLTTDSKLLHSQHGSIVSNRRFATGKSIDLFECRVHHRMGALYPSWRGTFASESVEKPGDSPAVWSLSLVCGCRSVECKPAGRAEHGSRQIH